MGLTQVELVSKTNDGGANPSRPANIVVYAATYGNGVPIEDGERSPTVGEGVQKTHSRREISFVADGKPDTGVMPLRYNA
jgi:hypothetical protein